MAKEPLYPHKTGVEARIKGIPTLPPTVTGPASLKKWSKERQQILNNLKEIYSILLKFQQEYPTESMGEALKNLAKCIVNLEYGR